MKPTRLDQDNYAAAWDSRSRNGSTTGSPKDDHGDHVGLGLLVHGYVLPRIVQTRPDSLVVEKLLGSTDLDPISISAKWTNLKTHLASPSPCCEGLSGVFLAQNAFNMAK